MNATPNISEQLQDHLATVQKLSAQTAFISDLAERIISSLRGGGKLILFGNGGSAADAQHIAAEFVVRFRRERKALPAIALTTDTSILTAGGNDFGFETIYARQVEALARAGDVAIGISTSGSSPNIVSGLRAAKEAGCLTVAFTGEKTSPCSALADLTFHAPSPITARIQECHLLVGHIVCDLVDAAFAP